MSEHQPTLHSEEMPSPAGRSKSWLLVVLIVIVACLIMVGLPVVITGWAFNSLQNDNATATAQAVLPPPGWQLTMDEHFSSDRNHWGVGMVDIRQGTNNMSDENEIYEWQIEARTKDGMLWAEYPAYDHPIGDFYVSVDCRQVSGTAELADYGMLFRSRNNDNYFQYAVAEDQSIRVSHRSGEDWEDLLPWEYTNLVRPGQVNQLAILAQGVHYKFFVNHQLVHELDNDRLSGGRIGLIVDTWSTDKAVFQFDNFQLYEPGE